MISIKVENLGKQYRLGQVGTGTISHDLNRWWHLARGKEDPYLKIGEANDRSTKGTSDVVWALKDINFEVKQGEVLGIIGKNGAGKSTLLKILSRVTGPTVGDIKVKGRIASLLEVGTGFHPELTGRENIFLNGAVLGMSKREIRSKFDEIVDFSGVERYVDTPVKRYSSGMYVRLAFAVAAHLEPEILVVDEVLAVGDAEFQKKAIGKMQDVSKGEGRTVLFVSHNMASMKSLCNRTILLEYGQIKSEGNTNEIVSSYLRGNSGTSSFGQIPSDYPRNSFYKNKIKILSVNCKGLDNIPKENFQMGEIIQLEFLFECYESIEDVLYIVSFMDEEINRISYTSSSKDATMNTFKLDKGVYMLQYQIQQQLLPSIYQVGFSIMNKDGYSFDAIEYFGNIKVENFGINDDYYPWGRRLAPTYFNGQFKIEKK